MPPPVHLQRPSQDQGRPPHLAGPAALWQASTGFEGSWPTYLIHRGPMTTPAADPAGLEALEPALEFLGLMGPDIKFIPEKNPFQQTLASLTPATSQGAAAAHTCHAGAAGSTWGHKGP
ncbi:unnamed protein product [Gulo gulo]|uniref:Uncharacterized protein n=1 Tax=Gulo gulo TaxID=48420 RepID=A0A9X9MCL1_GULGU|nr:unnamed protein product [Gulo gulo]